MDEKRMQGLDTVLSDKTERGKERPWGRLKEHNILLSQAYEEVNRSKAERLKWCASSLFFYVNPVTHKKVLEKANFCRVGLCPMCTWRRTLKIGGQTLKIIQKMDKEHSYCYIMLTLTMRNVWGYELKATIDLMMAAWKRLVKYAAFKDIMEGDIPGGWHRSMEIRHDGNMRITPGMYKCSKQHYRQFNLKVGDLNPDYMKFHPHFHVLIAVSKNYFVGPNYISQANFTKMWKQALQVDYTPVVDVRKVSGQKGQAVAECVKYSTKGEDYILPDDWDLTVETVKILDAALALRRLSAFGGVMLKWHKKLNLDDAEDGDLIHTDDDSTADEDVLERELHIVKYIWFCGYRKYIAVD